MSSILTENIKKTPPLISEITKNNDTEEEEDGNKIVIEDVTNLQQEQQQSSSKALSADTISKELQNLDFNTENTEEQGRYEFTYVPSQFSLKKDTEGKTLLKKWGFEFDMVYEEFRFDESFKPEKLDHFLLDFFNSRNVQGTVKVSSKRSGLVNMMGKATKVESEMLKTNVLNMSFFDKLKEENIIGENGYIRGCMPERYSGCEGGSLLREMFINEDSESYLAYDDDEREELLFHIMHRICIGGSMCQPEDNAKIYLSTAKQLYKEFVAVRKNKNTNALYVASVPIAINNITGINLFPDADSPHNFCYLIVDPQRRAVKYWSAAFVDFW